MSKEIQQPNITRPDLQDPFSWAIISRVHTEWVRQVGPQLDIDVEKYIRGSVLADIIGDDANCFTWTVGGSFFDSDIAIGAKRNLLERMNWEATTPETPSAIKRRLEPTVRTISGIDWSSKDGFNQAKTEWYKLKKWVEELIKTHPELKEAEDYMLVQNSRLSPYWQEFLYR